MDFGKIGQNLLQSATGNISKCILCVRLLEEADNSDDNDYDDVLTKAEEKAVSDVSKLNDDLMKLADKTLKNGKTASFDDVKGKAGSHDYLALEMQYNPTSLRLDTSAGRQTSYSGEAGSQQFQQYVTPASTTLSCELLFDNVNNMDAFMLADNPVTGLTVSNVKNAVMSAYKGTYSVKRQMEGLLSLLTIREARHVIFFWGAMSFRGEMTEVNARYTMFNKKGLPIRGRLGIQIRQGDSSDEGADVDKKYNYNEEYWRKSFDATFTANGPGASALSKIGNNSMLNLKL